jgi:predicted LPLAT superfamily acyltransferase
MAVKPKTEPRNPGPSWGYRFLCLCDRVLPEVLFRPLRSAGTWIAVLLMPCQRGFSKDYLRIVLGREPGLGDVHGHFFAECEALMLKLRVAAGLPYRCLLEPEAKDLAGWLAAEYPVLFGTFHVGNSDLTGFMLAGQERRRVHLVRLRVGNSHDTDALTSRFGDLLRFVWVNDPAELLFALKEAGSSGEAVALQCDRRDHSARSETFDFLGGNRVFPFTIYYLSMIFERPVLLSFGAPDGPNRSIVHASPAFVPVRGEPRSAALERARAHFQAFLRRVEAHLRAHPHQWLNFLPL